MTKPFIPSRSVLPSPLSLSQPIDGMELYLYLVASTIVVRVTLVRSDKDDKQKLVYFVSKMLTNAETRFTKFEQISLALGMAAKKLHPYFQAHTIIVLTSYLIKAILRKPDASGWILKWVVELSEFDIEYYLRSAIKGQVLVDFMVEMSDVQPRDIDETLWILETDGLSKAIGGGAGMVLQSLKGLSIAQVVKFAFAAYDNEAKYEAV